MGVSIAGLGVLAGEEWLFRELNLTVEPGRCVALVGPNGTGKSTVLRCVYGAQEPAEGTVTVCGTAPDERDIEHRRRVSVLLDDSDLFVELSPAAHVELLTHSFGHELDADDWLVRAGLAERADVPAGSLSAGQRRRLLLLGAIARPYQVLLLDEPERALDVAGKAWLTEVITGATERGAAVLVATHHRPLLDAADQVVELGAV